ncbi:hypothetical protein G7046_g9295 [Stylonectria norvegica]|nr:hypothetical protein G7046_g9295 [Stylonectria norvegica]
MLSQWRVCVSKSVATKASASASASVPSARRSPAARESVCGLPTFLTFVGGLGLRAVPRCPCQAHRGAGRGRPSPSPSCWSWDEATPVDAPLGDAPFLITWRIEDGRWRLSDRAAERARIGAALGPRCRPSSGPFRVTFWPSWASLESLGPARRGNFHFMPRRLRVSPSVRPEVLVRGLMLVDVVSSQGLCARN